VVVEGDVRERVKADVALYGWRGPHTPQADLAVGCRCHHHWVGRQEGNLSDLGALLVPEAETEQVAQLIVPHRYFS